MKKILYIALAASMLCISSCSSFEYDYYTKGASDIHESIERLQIDWPSGTVTLRYHDLDYIKCSEQNGEEPMAWYLTGNSLYIRYSAKSMLSSKLPPKDLVVYLPSGTTLDELDITGASCVVDADTDCRDIEIDTASGDIRYSTGITAEEMEIGTRSGNVTLALPEDTAFFLEYTSVSGNLSHSDFELEGKRGSYRFGDGRASKIEVETISGDLSLYHFRQR